MKKLLIALGYTLVATPCFASQLRSNNEGGCPSTYQFPEACSDNYSYDEKKIKKAKAYNRFGKEYMRLRKLQETLEQAKELKKWIDLIAVKNRAYIGMKSDGYAFPVGLHGLLKFIADAAADQESYTELIDGDIYLAIAFQGSALKQKIRNDFLTKKKSVLQKRYGNICPKSILYKYFTQVSTDISNELNMLRKNCKKVLTCPISGKLIKKPVCSPRWYVYEKKAINEKIKALKKIKYPTLLYNRYVFLCRENGDLIEWPTPSEVHLLPYPFFLKIAEGFYPLLDTIENKAPLQEKNKKNLFAHVGLYS